MRHPASETPISVRRLCGAQACKPVFLAFPPSQRHALEEVALGEEEDGHDRKHHEEGASHEHADASAGAGLERLNLESVKTEGEGI